MMLPIFQSTRKYLNNRLVVFKSTHIDNERNGSKLSRDNFVADKQYHSLVELAFKNGLSSFRGDNNLVVISCYDYRKNIFSFLVNLTNQNELYIISVFKGRRDSYYSYIKVQNRVNLFNTNFVLERLTDTELRIKNKSKIINKVKELDLSKEEEEFKAYTKNSKIQKL